MCRHIGAQGCTLFGGMHLPGYLPFFVWELLTWVLTLSILHAADDDWAEIYLWPLIWSPPHTLIVYPHNLLYYLYLLLIPTQSFGENNVLRGHYDQNKRTLCSPRQPATDWTVLLVCHLFSPTTFSLSLAPHHIT